MGVRWEYFGPPHNFQNGIDANFYHRCPGSLRPQTAGNQSVLSGAIARFTRGSRPVLCSRETTTCGTRILNNFGPRFGFSYDALGNQKMVVRGGFGVNYDRMFNNIFENIRFNPPFFALGLRAPRHFRR